MSFHLDENYIFSVQKSLGNPILRLKKSVASPPQSDFVKKLLPPSISILGKCPSQIHTPIFYKKPIERGSPKNFLQILVILGLNVF